MRDTENAVKVGKVEVLEDLKGQRSGQRGDKIDANVQGFVFEHLADVVQRRKMRQRDKPLHDAPLVFGRQRRVPRSEADDMRGCGRASGQR